MVSVLDLFCVCDSEFITSFTGRLKGKAHISLSRRINHSMVYAKMQTHISCIQPKYVLTHGIIDILLIWHSQKYRTGHFPFIYCNGYLISDSSIRYHHYCNRQNIFLQHEGHMKLQNGYNLQFHRNDMKLWCDFSFLDIDFVMVYVILRFFSLSWFT